MKRREFLSIPALFFLPKAEAQAAIEAMPFSSLKAGAPLPAWLEHVTFRNIPRHTEFALVEDDGRTVVRARANASTSALAREIAVDPKRYPLVAWRWKVMNLIAKSDMATKEGDDFPARLYVSFGRRALCYVWDSQRPVGTSLPNPYSSRVQMIVADSGPGQLGRWLARERDWVADYRLAFGAEAPVTEGVVVSADTDNTGETAESYFGDVLFRSRPTS